MTIYTDNFDGPCESKMGDGWSTHRGAQPISESRESGRTKWLNGWPRIGSSVLIGTATHCAGCGKFQGITCVSFTEGYVPPEKEPDWPFPEDSCPVCEASERAIQDALGHSPRAVELYKRVRQLEAELAALRACANSAEAK